MISFRRLLIYSLCIVGNFRNLKYNLSLSSHGMDLNVRETILVLKLAMSLGGCGLSVCLSVHFAPIGC